MVTVIDGRNLIHGRLASVVAEMIMGGEEVVVVNAEAIVDAGGKTLTYEELAAENPKGTGVRIMR